MFLQVTRDLDVFVNLLFLQVSRDLDVFVASRDVVGYNSFSCKASFVKRGCVVTAVEVIGLDNRRSVAISVRVVVVDGRRCQG